MSYLARCEALRRDVIRALKKKLPALDIAFGGKTPLPKRISVPTHADSKFQAEQALGDWAELRLKEAIDRALPKLRAVHYGFSGKAVAGEEGFRESYIAGIHDTCEYGKRADLLIVSQAAKVADDISIVPTPDTREIVGSSVGAIEVRSSRLEALRYIQHQKSLASAGKKPANLTPNFTVKLEDLVKVYRWIEVFDRPQAYAQVFLDVVYGIGVVDILNHIATSEKLQIDSPKRSGKVTIMTRSRLAFELAKSRNTLNLQLLIALLQTDGMIFSPSHRAGASMWKESPSSHYFHSFAMLASTSAPIAAMSASQSSN